MPFITETHTAGRTARSRMLVAAVVALAATSLVGPTAVGAARRASSGGERMHAAQERERQAVADRERADGTYGVASVRRQELEASLSTADAAGATTTEELVAARRHVRDLAVAAYIDGGRTELLQTSLQPDEAAAVSWRVGLISGGAGQVAEAIDRYESLVESNGPARRALADRLDRARAEEADALSALVQASAAERDARAVVADAARVEAAARPIAPATAPSLGDPSAVARPVPRSRAAASGPSGPAARVASSPAGLGIQPAGGAASADEAAFLARVRACESRGDYTISSSTGRYRGAYQFSVETWRGVGGSGDPAAASPAEQDARALALLRLQGRRAWPVCGR